MDPSLEILFGGTEYAEAQRPNHVCPLTQTNRQLRYETLPIFYGENRFFIGLPSRRWRLFPSDAWRKSQDIGFNDLDAAVLNDWNIDWATFLRQCLAVLMINGSRSTYRRSSSRTRR